MNQITCVLHDFNRLWAGVYADGGIGMDGEWAIPPGLKLKPP